MCRYLIILLLVISAVSCRTVKYSDTTVESTETAVPITNTKVEYRDRLVHDSIYTHDSVYVYINGDTIFKYKEKVNIRYVNKIDTIIKTDTIKVPVTLNKTTTQKIVETKEVYKMHWWQKFFMWVGILALISGIGLLILKLKKYV